MKKSTKKGFTLVELVIVIAVIAILSAILIPTFGNVISNANETKYQSGAKAGYEEVLANQITAHPEISDYEAIVVYYDGKTTSSATRAYLANGGNLTLLKDGEKVTVKSSATGTETQEINISVSGSKTELKIGSGSVLTVEGNWENPVELNTLYKVNDNVAVLFYKAA